MPARSLVRAFAMSLYSLVENMAHITGRPRSMYFATVPGSILMDADSIFRPPRLTASLAPLAMAMVEVPPPAPLCPAMARTYMSAGTPM